MSEQYVVFSHGQDGEPWGSKIVAMADVARCHRLRIESVDYRGMEPAARVVRLLEICRQLPGHIVLVGSSLGGHVSAAASSQIPTRGMFLLAPAFYMPGFEQFTPQPAACPMTIVHGWNDDIVPVENSIRFARQYRSTLHLIDSDHRMSASIGEVCELFDRFLQRLPAAAQ